MVGFWAVVQHNHFEGIHLIDCPQLQLYDNYLNVTHLEYDDNEWVNNVNFTRTTGTAQGGDATYITLAAGESSLDNFWNDCFITLTGGTGAGQYVKISDYEGSTKKAYASFNPAPDATTTYQIDIQYIDMMKAKTGYSKDNEKPERYYRRNTFRVEASYADAFGEDRDLLAKYLHGWENYMDKIYMEDNVFDLYILYWNFPDGARRIKEFVFTGNEVTAVFGTNRRYNQAFCYIGETLDEEESKVTGKSIVFEDNEITQQTIPSTTRENSFYLFCIDDTEDTDMTIEFNRNTLDLKELTQVLGSRNVSYLPNVNSRINADYNSITVERKSGYPLTFMKPLFADLLYIPQFVNTRTVCN